MMRRAGRSRQLVMTSNLSCMVMMGSASQSERTSSSIASMRINGSAWKPRCPPIKLLAVFRVSAPNLVYRHTKYSRTAIVMCVLQPICDALRRLTLRRLEKDCSRQEDVRLGCASRVYSGAGQERRAGVSVCMFAYVRAYARVCMHVFMCRFLGGDGE